MIHRAEVRVGELLAEGGEGRVYEVRDQPGTLYKAYREPPPAGPLQALVEWRASLGRTHLDLAGRVDASASWPTGLVTDTGMPPGRAAGLLLPRAPRRFSLRHRDGRTRLATLSYLTADPGQRAAAYGLALPAPFSGERVGIVYALARLLEAFQRADPAIGHGDLSTKNVLWSLERGPEVYVIDCDSCERYDAAGASLDSERRRRAMTPNWDDPAIASGANPTLASDRYSLALIFLRVVGAAHFPIQARQRLGEPLAIDFGVPPSVRRVRSLAPDAAIWEVCARSLSAAEPDGRPGAATWVGALEQVLDDIGAMSAVRSVWGAQGGAAPSAVPGRSGRPGPADVTVRPVEVAARVQRYERRGDGGSDAPDRWRGGGAPPAARLRQTVAGGATVAGAAPVPAASVPSVRSQLRAATQRASAAWLSTHRAMLAALRRRGARRSGAARLVGCAAMDFALVVLSAGVVAMLVSPWLGL